MRQLAIIVISALAACLPTAPAPGTPGVSGAPVYTAPAFQQSPQDLENVVQAEIDAKGYVAEGQPMQGTLDSFAPLKLSLVRGKCYKVVLRLDPNAQFSPHAKQGVGFVFTGIDEYGQVNGGPGIAGPGGVGSAGCPKQKAANASFDLQATWGSALDTSRIHDLGTGGYTVQLFSKKISDSELAARAAEEQRQIAQQEAFERQECAQCAREHEVCIADWRRGAARATCDREYHECYQRRGLRCR